jgi:3-methyladenine DNA glycosylase AlkD
MAIHPKYSQAIRYIMQHQNGETAHQMSNAGIKYNMNYGVSVSQLREFAKACGNDSLLAEQLWAENIRETKLLALMLWDPEELEPAKADAIAAEFTTGELAENASFQLFWKLPYAPDKVAEWCASDKVFVKMTGFLLAARLAKLDKKLTDEYFGSLFGLATNELGKNVIYIKKAICIALTAAAARSPVLREQVEKFAEEIDPDFSEAARFVKANIKSDLTYI